ncbi:unnamed protein product [Meganyctiphanes norvegica]|uniref:Uncharacterized protein n=1 Tax=Meganyctiphanes norvegica TaxID=48144 RepID=A0AAV2RJQ2_MEGNR
MVAAGRWFLIAMALVLSTNAMENKDDDHIELSRLARKMARYLSKRSISEEEDLELNRQDRALPAFLDPFGLLEKAGEAVQDAVDGVGKTLEEGAQHVGKMVQDTHKHFDTVFKEHAGNVAAGMEEAGKVATIVGSDLADGFKALVTNGLENNNLNDYDSDIVGPYAEDAFRRREGMVDGLLRMIGFDGNQIGLMALNVLIFLAEMITSSLIGEDNNIPETRSGKEQSFLQSLLMSNDPPSLLDSLLADNHLKMEAMMTEAQNPELPKHIVERLAQSTGDRTACVQLLVCKMSPVVWGMQRSVNQYMNPAKSDPDVQDKGILQSMYDSLPQLDDFVKFSETCEQQFPACPLLNLQDLGL